MRIKALVVAGFGVLLAAGGVGYGLTARASGAPDCIDMTPPCPKTLPKAELDAPWDESVVGLFLLPPPPGVEPRIDASEAVDIAWMEGGVAGEEQRATLALIPKGGNFANDTVVWVVRYDGACIASVGRRRGSQDPGCAYMPYWTMLDAETGDFIMSWTHSE